MPNENALFSDIHANLPALETMLEDLESHNADFVYCLGDLVRYNVWPNEDLVTTPESLNEHGKNYAYHLISPDNRNYLLTLPRHIRLEYQLNNDHMNIVLAQGSTRSIDEYVLEDLDKSYVMDMMDEAKAGILCVGHSHKPYHRILKHGKSYKHVINIGWVWEPKDGNSMGCYVILTVQKDSSTPIKEKIKVEFCRFTYDIERAAKAIEDSTLPDEFADRLRKAY